jgi:predicted AlkP superfamily phosphohydrolase/phosphomutase
MRVFILALDGLESTLVKKLNLKNLLQKTNGELKITSDFFHPTLNVPWSPKIWASFITGKHPSLFNIEKFWEIKTEYPLWVRLVKKMMTPLSNIIRGKGIYKKMIKSMNVKSSITEAKNFATVGDKKTIFNVVQPSIALNIPTYNENASHRERLSLAMMNRGIQGFEKEMFLIFKERKKMTQIKLKNSWKLFMTYLYISDLAGHIFFRLKNHKIEEIYRQLDEFAGVLKMSLPSNTIFLIVSDHGMSEKGHTNYAFWSLNIKTSWMPKSILDYYPKIYNWTRV